MKKIIALILVTLLCFSLVSCERDTAPEGMQSATVEGEPFMLYVPKTWTENTASGTSSASVKIGDYTVIVSARFTAIGESPLSDFVIRTIDSYAEGLGESFSLLSQSKTVLAGKDAEKLVYTFDNYTATQYFAKHKEDAVTLTFYATEGSAEAFADNISQIVDNFTLTDKKEVSGKVVIDKDTPDGMTIASSDKLEYRFYVPTTWVCFPESNISEAYYPESDKTNVTVTSYSPDSQMSLKEYYELCEKNYADNLNEYALLDTTADSKVAGLDAYDFSFSASYGGRAYRTRQLVLYSPVSGLFYNITYTATAENYKLHLDDFEAMLDAFDFR